MKRIVCSAATLLLAWLLAPTHAAYQDPVQDPDEEKEEKQDDEPVLGVDLDIFGRPVNRGLKGIVGSMQGAWQLIGMELDGYPEENRSHSGFLIVSDHFLALEIQAWWNPLEEDYEDGYQSFMAEFTVNEVGEMNARTLIGAYLDEDLTFDLTWEPSGYERSYTVTVVGDFLTLSWGADDKLEFARRRRFLSLQNDIYGRPDPEASEVEEEDIFGRRIKPKKEEGDG